MNIVQIKTTKISTEELSSLHCVHIPSIFTSCHFWPIQGSFKYIFFFQSIFSSQCWQQQSVPKLLQGHRQLHNRYIRTSYFRRLQVLSISSLTKHKLYNNSSFYIIQQSGAGAGFFGPLEPEPLEKKIPGAGIV